MKQLLSQDQLRQGVARLAGEITDFYAQRPLTILGVLTGSLVLLADLIRQLDMPLRVGVVQARSYRGTRRGPIVIDANLLPDVQNREVLLVDDIFDTGHTLLEVMNRIGQFQPKSIRSAVLLRKLGKQEVEMSPDFSVFNIPDEFVVGYGLDYQDAYRNLPYLAALEPHDLAGENE